MKRVVFTPEIVLRGLIEPTSLQILLAWRDGKLKPVISRDLALCYTKLLRAAGLGPDLLKRWLWWFTDPEKSEYKPEFEGDSESIVTCCEKLALANRVDGIVHSKSYQPPLNAEAMWMESSVVLAEI